MKNLAKTVILASALWLSAGTAFGKAIQQLHCSTTHCTYTEQLHKSGTTSFQGYCDGVHNITQDNSSMACHPVKGMTCTFSKLIEGPVKPYYWGCTCTNWSATKRQNASIDLHCPAQSQE